MDTDLYIAAKTGDKDYLQKPHSLQSIPCQATSQKRNALHIAANFKCIGFAEALVEKFPELLTRADFKGNTPLHIASRTGCSDMVKCFLESKNAKQALQMKNERADTALHVAVSNGHLEVVKPLVQENPKLLDLVNNHKESPLYLAVERGFFNIADELLKGNSSECSCEGTKGMTALHAAVIRTHKGPELGKPIPPELSVNGLGLHLRGEWFPGTQSNVGQEFPELSLEKLRRVVTNFFFRVRGHFKGKQLNDEIDIMEVLFEMKKDVIKKADEFGWTPLHYAAHLGHLKATEKLLKYDKSVAGLLDVEHSCALHIAAKEGHTNVMEQIITCLPDVHDLIDNKGRTILHVAAQYGNARVVKYILKKPNLESIINEPDNEGNTPLHLAAIYGHYGVVIMLAADDRVDKRAMNNGYLKTIDIVQSNMDIGEIIKYWIMRKLEHAGGRQSLHRLVIRDNAYMQNGDNEGYQENANMRTDNNGHQKSSDGIDRSASDSSTQSSDGIDRSASDTSTQSSDGASRTASNMSILLDRNREIMKEKELRSHRLKDISNTHLLVATLIATVTFAAGFTLPGGYNDDDPDKGKAVLSTKIAFKAFLLSDGIAFYCSTAAVFLHFFASLERNYHLLLRFIKFSAILTYVSILGMVIAFTSGIYLVLPSSSELSTSAFVLGCLFLTFYIFGVL
ncbi:ankyrin repeat-containing protein At5g02620-like isoform X2 [Vitis riparia]|uniref:ankyrin repeat-containing protein At5g02620-like isoform X2 n=1 Tax=Vitis riparia TaxID=96939 RepID=UPI00155ABE5B|nr:ankyrin repeat-containing protein At5g02620-like isoform X2 [Vitis riparia]